MDFIHTSSWEIFVGIEILSVIALVLFGVFRYWLNQRRGSRIFIVLFLLLLVSEGILAVYLYKETGTVSSIQLVIALFLLYACTFGIVDFIKLDRWMRRKIGALRGVELLTEKDYSVMKNQQNPRYVARKYRITSLIHLVLFLVVQSIFWWAGTESMEEAIGYIRDFSWIEAGEAAHSPYPNALTFQIGVLWGIVFLVDFIYSWSYTLFPKKEVNHKRK